MKVGSIRKVESIMTIHASFILALTFASLLCFSNSANGNIFVRQKRIFFKKSFNISYKIVLQNHYQTVIVYGAAW